MKKIIASGLNGNLGKTLKSCVRFNNIKLYDYQKTTLKSFNRFIHLAAKHPIHSYNQIINSNIIYLDEVINKFDWEKKDFIFLSSTSVYQQNYKNIRETNKLNYGNIYSISKIIGENMLYNSKIKSLVIRVPGIISINDNYSLLSNIISKLRKNENINLINGNSKFNSFIDPYDLSNFIINLNKIKKFDIINLSGPGTHSLLQLVNLFKESLKSKSKIKNFEYNKKIPSVNISKALNKYCYIMSDIETIVNRITKKIIK